MKIWQGLGLFSSPHKMMYIKIDIDIKISIHHCDYIRFFRTLVTKSKYSDSESILKKMNRYTFE